MPSSLKKNIKKWSRAFIVLSVVLCLRSVTVYACLDYVGNLSDGSPVFFSCGSSAGNYALNPDADGVFTYWDPDIDTYCNSCGSCYTACLSGISGVARLSWKNLQCSPRNVAERQK